MEAPRLNCFKGMLVLLLFLQTAGGTMAQNGSQNRSQNRSQNGSQNRSQNKSQDKSQNRPQGHNKPLIETPVLDKWTGSVELMSGLGISHLSNDNSDPSTHLLEQVKLILSRSTSTFSFNTEAQGFFEKNETFTQRTTMRGQPARVQDVPVYVVTLLGEFLYEGEFKRPIQIICNSSKIFRPVRLKTDS